MPQIITSTEIPWSWKTPADNRMRFIIELQIRGGWVREGKVTTHAKLIYGWGQKRPKKIRGLTGDRNNPSDKAKAEINELLSQMFDDPSVPEQLKTIGKRAEIRKRILGEFEALWPIHAGKLKE